DPARVPLGCKDPGRHAPDRLKPVRRRVHEDEFVDGEPLTQARETAQELWGVGRPASDDRDLHPFTPVRVTPRMNARWASRKIMMTGAMTSSVAAIVRFQFTWCALLKDCRP